MPVQEWTVTKFTGNDMRHCTVRDGGGGGEAAATWPVGSDEASS